ncbi:PQQ-dependent sugar dehydrogenase [Puniceicoccus vermicola]|uniref:PQQ-dependent sugar dehydrogenase n=1 Tax=Puniceicoccus vermicola TaxID=388746 RepID=A0A7X1B113_9BACT|nr:PQQ-dependent sugar dehydrogenase [Puniceicoccus vermicola]MBC2603614.1 PQQ-dependent sugar dehydrogenase [Puniceicoccus vermicola]
MLSCRFLGLAPLFVFLVSAAWGAGTDIRQLYQNQCAGCHGEEMEGGGAPTMLDSEWRFGSEREAITSVIRDGRPAVGMPSFGETLSEEEIRGLVILIREMNADASPDPGAKAIRDGVFESDLHQFRMDVVAEDLELPWSMAFLPDGRWLIAERGGVLMVMDPSSGERLEIEGIPEVYARGQGGLLDIQTHPDYVENRWIYLSFSDPSEDGERGMTAIVRGRIQDGKWIDEEEIFRAPPEFYLSGGVHFGCRLVFQDGYLFFTIGERGRQDQAQDLSRPNGKVHRIYDDGRIPEDNPFVGEKGAFPSIWTYGNRNPQGLALDRKTGILWETEHGPRGGDELNIIEKGLNYGWPVVTYGMNYNGTPITGRTSAPGMKNPVTYWTPSLAVCGLAVYRGDAFPEWDGSLLSSSLSGEELRLLVLDGREVAGQEVLVNSLGRLRDVVVGPDGAVYLVCNNPGRIVKMSPVQD